MKLCNRLMGALLLAALATAATAATQFSEKDYNLYAGDFNGDGRSDLLYIGKTPDKPNGIALADLNGVPQIGFQSWPATYLGIPWSTGQFIPAVGDFNGDGKSDVLMQAATAGTSYVVLANTNTALGEVGQFIGVQQEIVQTQFGVTWSADQHKLLVGDFDGDGKDDVLLQAMAKGGTNAIVLTDGSGNMFTRSSSFCRAGGPQQCWTDGEQALDWSTKSAVLTIGKFNADLRADILYQARPKIVLIDYEIPIPVPTFKPNTFGIFLGQIPDGAGKIVRTINQPWNHNGLGTAWSPLNATVLVGNFDGLNGDDVLLQFKGGTNRILYTDAVGVLGNAVTPAANVASWNSASYTAVVGKFGNSTRSVLYLQAKDGSGSNYYTTDISVGSVTAYTSSLILVASVPTAPPVAIGATPATADVTQNGTATYSIPIQLPKGTAGLTPDLALSYSSGSGNGLLGVGWNLTGLGTIARCPKTIAQDGVTLGVQLTAADEYCLNGNRLRRVSGTQGAVGSMYRTELETFALVTVVTATTTGPEVWRVQTKDGLIYEYGGTANSRIGVPGNATVVRVWALSKVSDRATSNIAGNFWTVTYINDVATNGSYRPDFVDYTTHASAVPAAAPYRVKFFYENRNAGEQIRRYYQGGLIIEDKRLQRVELQSSGGLTMIRKYTLGYQASAPFNVKSRLASMQECSPTACMAPTAFAWTTQAVSSGQPQTSSVWLRDFAGDNFSANSFPLGVGSMSLDLNGDGIADGVTFSDAGDNVNEPGLLFFSLGVRAGELGQEMTQVMNYVNWDFGMTGVTDLNGDGKDEVLFYRYASAETWQLHQRPDGSIALDVAMPGVVGMMADVDGDGFKDSVNIHYSDNTHLYVRYHNRDGSPGFEATDNLAWTAPSGTTIADSWSSNPYHSITRTLLSVADVNGDGLQDIFVQVNNGWRTLYSTGTGFSTGDLLVTALDLGSSPFTAYLTPIPIDLNGDGCTDVSYPGGPMAAPTLFVAVSRCQVNAGAGFVAQTNTGLPISGIALGGHFYAVDWDSDGMQDLAVQGAVWRSTGVGLSAPLTLGPGFAIWSDRDGDGILDLSDRCSSTTVAIGCDFMLWAYQRGLGQKSDLMLSATDGFGKVIEFAYAPLTDPAVYTRGTAAIGKTQDVQAPMYVVQSMKNSDGVGGTYTNKYKYSAAKRNVSGRGFLGFAGRTIEDSRTKFVTEEVYNNTVNGDHTQWEYVGTLANRIIRQYAGGPLVEELTQQYNSITPAGNSAGRYPYVGTSILKRYELTGPNYPVSTSTTTTLIDWYGTPYDVTTVVAEGPAGQNPGGINPSTSVTQRRYTPTVNILNDTTNWCLSRTQRLEETRSHTLNVLDGAAITRTSTQVWDAAKCRVTNTAVEPGSLLALNTLIEYDAFNNVNKTTVTGNGISPSPRITQAYFGTNGHLPQWVENAKAQRTTFTWNVNLGFMLTQTDPNTLITTRSPDDFGREKRLTRPDGTSTFKTYFNCTMGNSYCGDGLLRYVVRTEERNTADSQITYSDEFVDMVGRVKYVQSKGFAGETVIAATLYDNRGNVALKTNSYFAGSGAVSGISMSYDYLNRLTKTQKPTSDSNPALLTEHSNYNGLTTTTVDANGKAQVKIANMLGAVARATDAAGKNTNYTYNGFGELLSATDPAGNASTIHYNIRGFKDYSNDPDLGHWVFTYDALGQMLTQVDAKNQITTFTYDQLGRSATRIDHGGGVANTTTWTWDTAVKGVGQLAMVTSPGSYSETYLYDTVGRRSKQTTVANAGTYVMDYGYDASTGKPKSVAYPASTGTRLSVEYSYLNGHLKDVRDASAGLALIWEAKAQDAQGHVTWEKFGNNQESTLGFDRTNGRLSTIQTGVGAATQNLTYNWDGVGNLVSRRDNAQGITESFTYDDVYRLTTVQRNGVTTQTMAYSDIGNITSKSDVGSYLYSGAQAGCSYYSYSQPHAVRKVGTNVYCYDANGNMVSRSGAAVTWSTFNYPAAINQAGGNTSTFYYGANRNRYRQVSIDAGVTENRVTVAGGAFEKLIRGTTVEYRHFIQAGAKVVAIVKRGATTALPTTIVPANSSVYYLHSDHLGSTDVITNSGGVVARLSFDAWGMRRGNAWTGTPTAAEKTAIGLTTRKGYTGHDQLDNLNLVHMNGRVYDPVIARFLSADPIVQDPYHSQSFNRYSYIWNNPLNGTDPTGLVADCVVETGSRVCRFKETPGTGTPDGQTAVGENGHKQVTVAAANPKLNQTGAVASAQENGSTPDLQKQAAEEKPQNSALQAANQVVNGVDNVLTGGQAQAAGNALANGNYVMGAGYVAAGVGMIVLNVATLGQGTVVTNGVRAFFTNALKSVGAAGGVAGSVRGINVLRSTTNCVNCAIAVDATLGGRAASALPSGPTSITVLEKMFGGQFARVGGSRAIESQLLGAGSGARGIVFGSRGAGEVGHVFNAVNQNGVVRFLDGQAGGAASVSGFESLFFLRTF
jgi:RHS repeat-associated protein